MSVEIKETDFGTIVINGKEIYKDANENWICRVPLNSPENDAFVNYVKSNIIAHPMDKIFEAIKAERKRQDQKFGSQNHLPMEWLAILGEEVGEVNKACLESYFGYPSTDQNYSDYRKELIEVAAVAIAMIESLDRNRDTIQRIPIKGNN